MKQLFNWLLFVITVVLLTSCYATRAYRYRKFLLKDVNKQEAAPLPASVRPFSFVPTNPAQYGSLNNYLDSELANTNTYAFIVIRNDSILYEKYFGTLEEQSRLPSFSVAKSFVSTLVGIAFEEGKITALSDPVTKYLPRLLKTDKGYAQVTIQHLLDMRSGVNSSENYYNPFSDVLKLGFTKNIAPRTLHAKLAKPPGTFEYRSINTQLLAMVLEKATGKKLQNYLAEKLWQPLGMQHNATWNIDSKKHGTARAFCCINAAAIDYAKFGGLMLKQGNWNGQQLISQQWVQNSVSADTMKAYEGYRNQWWARAARYDFEDSASAVAFKNTRPAASRVMGYIPKGGNQRLYQVRYYTGSYHAQGILEQYIYVNPANNVVIVRLGYYWKHPKYGCQTFVYRVGDGL